MVDEPDEIKNELQGDGFLNKVKESRLPDSSELTEEALAKYESTYASLDRGNVQERADRILQRLLELEIEAYEEAEEDVYKEALVEFLENEYDSGQTSLHSFESGEPAGGEFAEYPNLQEMFTDIEEIYESGEDFVSAFSKILPQLYPAIDAISVSAQQSRRKRAGDTLREHLENLIEKGGYTIEDSQVVGNGVLYQVRAESDDSEDASPVYLSCLTTLKDRFRQSLSQRSDRLENHDVPKFIATGSGNNVFTSSSGSDVTHEKIQEISQEGFTLIVFEEIKNQKFADDDAVISYSEFLSNNLATIVKP